MSHPASFLMEYERKSMSKKGIVERRNKLMEDQGHRFSVVSWITLLVASIMMLFIVNSILHYAPNTSGVTLIDLAGDVLPYGLLVIMFFYYLLRLDARSIKVTTHSRRPRRTFKLSFLVIGATIISIVPFVVVILLLEIFGLNRVLTTSPTSTVSNGSGQPIQFGAITFDPWFILSAFSVVFTLTMLFAVTSLGKRRRSIEETEGYEEIETKSIPLSANRYVDDDYRMAIIAYYAQGREHMVNQGVPLTDAMTPREFGKNVFNSLSVAGKDFTSLTNLFEEARFSIHPMSHSEQTKARNHYEKLSRINTDGKMTKIE